MKVCLLICLMVFIVSCNSIVKHRAIQNNNSSSLDYTLVTGKTFVKNIEALGYHDYVDRKILKKLKKNQIEFFDPNGVWGAFWDDDSNSALLDYRHYYCDGEFVHDQGGFLKTLEEMQPTFDKINFKISIDQHFEEWDAENKWLNQTITVNGTNYIIYENYQGIGWGLVVKRLAEILNAELDKQNIDENIYLMSGGNDGSLLILNKELYKYFYSVFTDPWWKPLEVGEWTKVMKVEN